MYNFQQSLSSFSFFIWLIRINQLDLGIESVSKDLSIGGASFYSFFVESWISIFS